MATSTVFAGTSRYSADFSAVIERSVGIASLALRQMESARSKSNNEVTALTNLQTEVGKIRTTLAGLESSVAGNPLQATSSHSSLLQVRAGDNVSAGSFRVSVVSLGSYSTAVGKTAGRPETADPNATGWLDPSVTKLTLRTVDHTTNTPVTKDLEIDLEGATSLQDVVKRINAVAGSSVQAAFVNVGTTDAPNYAMTLQSNKLGKIALQLKAGSPPPADASGDLLDVDENDAANAQLGTRATYKVNGATVTSDSRTITLAPGLTADLVKADASTDVTVDVNESTTATKNALRAFATEYNVVLTELAKMSGSNGALLGNSIIASIRDQLRQAVTRTFNGTFGSMASVGLEFDKEGVLSLNEVVFDRETAGRFTGLQELIGSATDGGLTKALTDAVEAMVSDKGTGFLNETVTSLKKSLEAEDKRIAAETERIEKLTEDLQERMAKADAMIAQLEQQATYFTNMFEAMRANQKSMS